MKSYLIQKQKNSRTATPHTNFFCIGSGFPSTYVLRIEGNIALIQHPKT